MAMYFAEDTPGLLKAEIVRIVLGKYRPRETDILIDAVQQPWLDTMLRELAVTALAVNGVVESVDAIQASLAVDRNPRFVQAAGEAIKALEEMASDSSESL